MNSNCAWSSLAFQKDQTREYELMMTVERTWYLGMR